MRTKDLLPGMRINNIEVIGFEHTDRYGIKHFRFKCFCGELFLYSGSSVIRGNKLSCGCVKERVQNKTKANKKLDNYSLKRKIWNKYKLHAKNRNIDFNISMEDFVPLLFMNCGYCNLVPSNKVVRHNKHAPDDYLVYQGVDRIDNSKGYDISNCRPCCSICNWSKSNRVEKEFLDWITRVYNHSIKNNVIS